MAISNTLNPWAPRVLSIVRVVAGLVFLAHGSQKLLGFPASDMNPPMFSIFWFAGAIELIAGTLITIGLFTRPAAFIASGLMAFAYFIAHAPQNFFPLHKVAPAFRRALSFQGWISGLEEGQQVRIDDIGMRRGHAMRQPLVNLQRAVL
jgi:putative oxidoreductase